GSARQDGGPAAGGPVLRFSTGSAVRSRAGAAIDRGGARLAVGSDRVPGSPTSTGGPRGPAPPVPPRRSAERPVFAARCGVPSTPAGSAERRGPGPETPGAPPGPGPAFCTAPAPGRGRPSGLATVRCVVHAPRPLPAGAGASLRTGESPDALPADRTHVQDRAAGGRARRFRRPARGLRRPLLRRRRGLRRPGAPGPGLDRPVGVPGGRGGEGRRRAAVLLRGGRRRGTGRRVRPV